MRVRATVGQPEVMRLPDSTLVLAGSQHGVITRRQLREAGITRDTLRWRVGRDWRLLLPGVYVLQTGLPSERQRLVAAQLAGGEGAWLAGSTAAALHGLRSCSVGVPIRVLVAAPKRSRRVAWVDIRSTTLTGEPVVDRDGLRVGCLARAVVDAAAETPDEGQARALVIEAAQRSAASCGSTTSSTGSTRVADRGPSACAAFWPRSRQVHGRCLSPTCSR